MWGRLHEPFASGCAAGEFEQLTFVIRLRHGRRILAHALNPFLHKKVGKGTAWGWLLFSASSKQSYGDIHLVSRVGEGHRY
jgi:hypothetical protein